MDIIIATLTECIGTFVFLSIIVSTTHYDKNNFLGPFSIGIGLLGVILFGGDISGGHFNPAVTMMLLIRKKISYRNALLYVFAQTAGGVLAALWDMWRMNIKTRESYVEIRI